MGQIARFGMSLDTDLLARFDDLIETKGYSNRSEAIRDLIREKLVEAEWAAGNMEVVGTVSLVYNHHALDLPKKLTDIQHKHHPAIVSTTHVHLDRHNCLEVLILRGKGSEIKALGEKLVSTKGVKHGKLALTTIGRDLS